MTYYSETCKNLDTQIDLRDHSIEAQFHTETCTELNDILDDFLTLVNDVQHLFNLFPGRPFRLNLEIEDLTEKHEHFHTILDDPANLQKEEKTAYFKSISKLENEITTKVKSFWDSTFTSITDLPEFTKNSKKLPDVMDFQTEFRKLARLQRLTPTSSDAISTIKDVFPNCSDLDKEIKKLVEKIAKAMKADLEKHNTLPQNIQKFISEADSEEGKPLKDLSPELLEQLRDHGVEKDYRVVRLGE